MSKPVEVAWVESRTFDPGKGDSRTFTPGYAFHGSITVFGGANVVFEFQSGASVVIPVGDGYVLTFRNFMLRSVSVQNNTSGSSTLYIIIVGSEPTGEAPSISLATMISTSANISAIGGVGQSGADWTPLFQNISAKANNLNVALSTRASESTLSSVDTKLDVALSALARLKRWGRDIEPSWVDGSEVTAPAAGTALVSKTVSAGKSGYIYGFFISAGEGNDFKINWTSGGTAYSKRIVFIGKGTLQYVDFAALNEGKPADAETSITITNVNNGGAGVIYQASILYAEI